MKAFLVLCLAAAVSAEADPQLLTYGVSPFYSALRPAVVYRKPEEVKKIEYKTVVPSTYAINPLTPFGYGVASPAIVPRYYAKSAENVEHVVAKREAEAEADPYYFYNAALPFVPYSRPAVYSGYYNQPLVAPGVKTYANDAISLNNYASKGQYVAVNEGAVHVAKREAEAEPEADPALIYRTVGYPYASAVRPIVPTVRSAYTYSPYTYSAYNNLAYNRYYY